MKGRVEGDGVGQMTINADRAAGARRSASTLKGLLARFADCRGGATSIEYGLICSLIFIAIVVSVQGVASKTTAMHTNISNSL